jgi:outer membrane protein assembly factor BamD (BamD/ComL family)
MEVYANLNSINITEGNKEEILLQKLNNLLKLAKREKYVTYRDIIYYAAAQVELERNNITGAQQLLKRSIVNSIDNPIQKSISFLLLADLTYDNKAFTDARNFYDSIEVSVIANPQDANRITARQTALQTVVRNYDAMHLEDSLQRVAAMPEAEREAHLRKVLRKIRRAQGLAEEADQPSVNPAVRLESKPDLFNSSAKGDWYFNNNALKSSGFSEFRQRWGNRPNIDNWRRQAEIEKVSQQDVPEEFEDETLNTAEETPLTAASTTDDLAATLPLTEEQVNKSNENIQRSIFDNAKIFQNQLENYGAAIDAYNELNNKFPGNQYTEESLFNLYYCYTKLGEKQKADSCLTALKTNFSDSKYVQMLGSSPSSVTSNVNPATKEYENIYNLFIEGKFDEAKAKKEKADSAYGNSYWTPQLLYIESIYYVSQKEDSIAIDRLSSLSEQHGGSPLAEKATTMIDVLRRRTEIENYLTSLEITRDEEEAIAMTNLNPIEPNIKPEIKRDSIVSKPATNPVAIKVDTVVSAPVTVKTFTYKPEQPQYVLILLNQVAPVFANEAKNAFLRYNKEKYYNEKIDISSVKLDDQYNLVLMGPFSDALVAMDYVEKTKPLTSGRILPWLTADKYTYTIISEDNLDLLKDNKDVEGYRSLIKKVLPGKF